VVAYAFEPVVILYRASGRSVPRAATLKISFHFCAAPTQTPPPLGEISGKEIFGLLATSTLQKLHSNLHLLESFSFRFFTVLWRPRRFARSRVVDTINLHSQTRHHLARAAHIRSRSLLSAGDRSPNCPSQCLFYRRQTPPQYQLVMLGQFDMPT